MKSHAFPAGWWDAVQEQHGQDLKVRMVAELGEAVLLAGLIKHNERSHYLCFAFHVPMPYAEAVESTVQHKFRVCWTEAVDESGNWRVIAAMIAHDEASAFDQLFAHFREIHWIIQKHMPSPTTA